MILSFIQRPLPFDSSHQGEKIFFFINPWQKIDTGLRNLKFAAKLEVDLRNKCPQFKNIFHKFAVEN